LNRFAVNAPAPRLLLLSFLMLFVELALIRWLGSNVVYLSYFSNFVLLGSFLGIGVGFLRAKSRTDLFPWAATALAGLVGFIFVFPVRIDRSGSDLVYFGGTLTPDGLPIWLSLPVVFMMVAIVMAAIAQGVARTFALFKPLDAYRLDILGSLAGITAFTILSFLGAPPLVWGLVVAVVFVALYGRSLRLIHVVALVGMAIMLGHESFVPGDSWSPYYKVSLFDAKVAGIKGINVNGIPHQIIESTAQRRIREPVYFVPYQRIVHNPLRDVLIVGAGNGADVAIALAAGAKHIDAVEIDPRIYQIGRQVNPNHPYQDPRVTVHINDGRAFLQQSRNKYDLILFALPDSLVLVSGQSSLRLESYLFTAEAMQAARTHLTSGGVFGMYNYYRETWLIDRLAGTLNTVYGRSPCVDHDDTYGRFAVLMAARNPGYLKCGQTWVSSTQPNPPPATDNYPFPYLRTPSIPPIYLITIAAILLTSVLVIRWADVSIVQMRRDLDLFFMGAAFLLLETKNVVQFALLFGTTWLVNALVFFGILLSVFAAVEVARHVRIRYPSRLYIALFGALAVAWAVQPQSLLSLSLPVRFISAVALAFAPIFLANLVFAERFRNAGSSTVAFGANLLGAMVGGILEYSSLLFGYRSLLLVVAVLYALAYVFGREQLTVRATGPQRESGMPHLQDEEPIAATT
jgi:Spermine/spermidine synthase domain